MKAIKYAEENLEKIVELQGIEMVEALNNLSVSQTLDYPIYAVHEMIGWASKQPMPEAQFLSDLMFNDYYRFVDGDGLTEWTPVRIKER